MKMLQKIYHFLGSITFALILIGTTALLVIAGTFIESLTDSHRFASTFTYSSPFFSLLLLGFFLNILVSALRRWPFRIKHIPFLITHLGLLMILTGAIIKNYRGVQGSLHILEGGGNQTLLLADTYALQIREKDSNVPRYVKLSRDLTGRFNPINTGSLHIEPLEYAPHSSQYWETWIKGGIGFIRGLKPFPVYQWDKTNPLPLSAKISLEDYGICRIHAFQTSEENLESLIEHVYLQDLTIKFTDRLTGKTLLQEDLKNILGKDIALPLVKAHVKLHIPYSSVTGLSEPNIQTYFTADKKIDEVSIALEGSESLLNKNISRPHFGAFPIAIDLVREPALCFVQDEYNDIHLFAFDRCGRISRQIYPASTLESILVYEEGFGGYAVRTILPFRSSPESRAECEKALLDHLEQQLREGISKGEDLAPPLELLQQTCLKADADFIQTASDFLAHWNNTNQWLYPENLPLPTQLEKVFQQMPSMPKACHWIAKMFTEIDPLLKKGDDPLLILQRKNWPLLEDLKGSTEPVHVLTGLTQQFFGVEDVLPLPNSIQEDFSPSKQARFFSAYLRAYSIHLHSILAPLDEIAKTPHSLAIETTLSYAYRKKKAETKMEENLPLITLQIGEGKDKELITLIYDRLGAGFQWPVLQGKYLLRFQPEFKPIPYRVRLRNARQVNYPHSSQPYSFESDIIVTHINTQKSEEKTISMNNIHETWDGYRFYLSSISPSTEGAVKTVNIVVNHDPAKYWSTYPGAVLLALGIVLLFWFKTK